MGLAYWTVSTYQQPLNEYPCRDKNGSLLPVPIGKTRTEVYCRGRNCPYYQDGCRIKGCLFVPTTLEEHYQQRRKKRYEGQPEATRRRLAKLRSQGLNSNGEALAHTCWNCSHVRQVGTKYVCKHAMGQTFSAGQMQQRSACKNYQLRDYLDILPVEYMAA